MNTDDITYAKLVLEKWEKAKFEAETEQVLIGFELASALRNFLSEKKCDALGCSRLCQGCPCICHAPTKPYCGCDNPRWVRSQFSGQFCINCKRHVHPSNDLKEEPKEHVCSGGFDCKKHACGINFRIEYCGCPGHKPKEQPKEKEFGDECIHCTFGSNCSSRGFSCKCHQPKEPDVVKELTKSDIACIGCGRTVEPNTKHVCKPDRDYYTKEEIDERIKALLDVLWYIAGSNRKHCARLYDNNGFRLSDDDICKEHFDQIESLRKRFLS